MFRNILVALAILALVVPTEAYWVRRHLCPKKQSARQLVVEGTDRTDADYTTMDGQNQYGIHKNSYVGPNDNPYGVYDKQPAPPATLPIIPA